MNESNKTISKVDALLAKHRKFNSAFPTTNDGIPVLTDVVSDPGVPDFSSIDPRNIQQMRQVLIDEVFAEIDKTLHQRLATELSEVLEHTLLKLSAEMKLNLKDVVRDAVLQATEERWHQGNRDR